MVLASAILATGGMLVAGGYGLASELVVLWALAIEAALAAWQCLHICRLRRQAAWAEQQARTASPAAAARSVVSRWYRELDEEYDETPDSGCVRHALQLH